jgi:hypothetical protein
MAGLWNCINGRATLKEPVNAQAETKKEAPGRFTSASPKAQSIRTIPQWITSFSADLPTTEL